jgi:hypothetical protein
MTLIVISEGRLGNQVFQFVAARRFLGLNTVFSPSLRTLGQVFELSQGLRLILSGRNTERLIRRVLVPLLIRPLFKWLRLGTYCAEPIETMENGSVGQSGRAIVQKGLLPLAFVDGGYYQNLSDLLSPADFLCLKVRRDVLAAAGKVVAAVMAGRPWPKAVMHVRRGDYIGFKSYGLDDVVLPVAYFERAAAKAREQLGSEAEILVVTDDAVWCERELAGLKPFVVVSGSEAVDFALLSMFPVAILSNSTFSLAAACVGPAVERVIGPEYWFGHSVQQWYPPRIKASDERFVYV